MPELPEVETVRIGLSELLPGREIRAVDFDWSGNTPGEYVCYCAIPQHGSEPHIIRHRIPDTSPHNDETLTRAVKSLATQNTPSPYSKSFPNAPADVQQFLVGAKVVAVARRAKVLLIELSSKYSLVIHLKMTGQLVFVAKDRHPEPAWPAGRQPAGRVSGSRGKSAKTLQPANGVPDQVRNDELRFGAGHPSRSLIGELPDKSTRVTLHLSGKDDALESDTRKQRSAQQAVQKVQGVSTGAADTVADQERCRSFGLRPKAGQCDAYLFFNDQRKFGWMRLMPTAEVVNLDFFKKVGPEPLSADFSWQDMRQRLLRRKNTNIKAALLDQTVIAGIGNIYADEALWGAKLHPSTLVRDISAAKFHKLYDELIYVLKLSIEKGGSTDRNYVDAKGRRGSYMSFARVFRREGQDCQRCGHTIEKIRVAGRGTHICPHCQRKAK